mgnify:CR=1 FL=1
MLIKNCMLIDGADIFEEMKDIRIVNGKIKEVVDCLMPEGDEEIAKPATQKQGDHRRRRRSGDSRYRGAQLPGGSQQPDP